jgi:cytochrome c
MRIPAALVAAAVIFSCAPLTDVKAADGKALYLTKTCIACHGKEGNKPIMSTYPRLAGQDMEYLLVQMKDIKSGARANGGTPGMKGVMHLVTDEDMKAIAEYLSKIAPQAAK